MQLITWVFTCDAPGCTCEITVRKRWGVATLDKALEKIKQSRWTVVDDQTHYCAFHPRR